MVVMGLSGSDVLLAARPDGLEPILGLASEQDRHIALVRHAPVRMRAAHLRDPPVRLRHVLPALAHRDHEGAASLWRPPQVIVVVAAHRARETVARAVE